MISKLIPYSCPIHAPCLFLDLSLHSIATIVDIIQKFFCTNSIFFRQY